VIIFGPQWREAGEALVAMALLPAGAGVAAVVEEALKAIGQPRYVVRINGLITVVTLVAIVALQPFGLAAAAAGLSIGAAVGGLYSLWLMNRVTAVSLRAMLAEIWPPLLAASFAALGILALETFVVDAESHGTLAGGLLVVAEALAGAMLYLAAIRVLAPEVSATLREGAGTVMRRVARFRGPDPVTPEPEPLDQTLAP
jgi:PST family polysaccharide transporter